MMLDMRKLILLLCVTLASLPATAQEEVEVIVVTGRRPGPPLWKVSNGDHTLWILPLISSVPRNMEWDDTRVADLIASADQFIDEPNVTFGVSRTMMLNPVNVVRALRLMKRLSASPDGKPLQEILPATLYARFTAIKGEYFARDEDAIERMRPSIAANVLRNQILEAENLVSPRDITRRLERHVRRNRNIVHTEMQLTHRVEGSYREISERAEALMGSLGGEQEIACFDLELGVFEQHLDDIKSMANAWANGAAEELEDFRDPDSLDNPCAAMLAESTEGQLLVEKILENNARWLDVAEAALETNHSTFAVLPLSQIIGANSLVAQLGTRGFTVHDPR
jgi:hypothetical protein